MANETKSKPNFFSTLPGILTALGGVIIAATGLITALYSNGVIGSKDASNAAATSNTVAKPASTPSSTPSPNIESDKYKPIAGKWEVIEEQPEDVGGTKTTWQYDAAVAGNKLTLKGKIIAVNGNSPPPDKQGVSASCELTLADSMGTGKLRQKDPRGTIIESPASIVLDESLESFNGTLIVSGHKCTLTGRKQ